MQTTTGETPTAKFSGEYDQTGYGPRIIVDVDYPTKPTFRNLGWNVFQAAGLRSVRPVGTFPDSFDGTDYGEHNRAAMGWVTARFLDGSTTSVFLSRHNRERELFEVGG